MDNWEKISGVFPYTILLAEDNHFFRNVIKSVLSEKPDLKIVGEADDVPELLSLMETVTPHMVILDISMPGISGIEAAHKIKKSHPGVKVLILTMHKGREYLHKAVSSGAKGYLTKENVDLELFHAIKTIREGGVYFPSLMIGDALKGPGY